MTPAPRPPAMAERLLARVLPGGRRRDAVLGDLAEEFDRRARVAPRRARLWYWAEALDVAAHYLVEARRRRAVDADPDGRRTMDGWARDVRHGLRRLARSPGVGGVIVATMAVAIGANAAIFGAVRPVLAPELPFPEPDRLVRVWEQNLALGWSRSSVSWHDARDWAEQSRSFESLAVYNVWEGNLVTDDQAQRIQYGLVEPDFFRVLGVPPLLGRALLPDEIDPSRGDVVVLGHGLWTRAFGADPAVVGRSIDLGGARLEVVGVMPPSFAYPSPDVDAWKPMGMTPDEGGTRDSYWLSAIGRLHPDVALEEAQREMTAIGERLEAAYPETNEGARPLLEPMAEVAVLDARQGVLLLWGAVALLLVVACANVATLLLARGEARVAEMAVRTALGAGRASLVRQLLAESLVLSALGGVLGVALAVPAAEALQGLLGARFSYGLGVELDPLVLAYTLAVTALAGVAFGLLPALRISAGGGPRPGGARGAASGPGTRLGPVLVAGQTALAVVILVGAGLLGRSIAGLGAVDPGYEPAGALAFRVAPSWTAMERNEAAALLGRIRERVAGLPGVTAVGVVNRLPLAGNAWGAQWTDRTRLDTPGVRAFARVVLPGYVDALGLPVLEGRALLPTDDARAEPVAMVSAATAARYWPDETPVGRYVSLAPDDERAPWIRVVGVVGDVEGTSLGAGPTPLVYTPFEQSVFGHFGDWGMDFVVRTDASGGDLAAAVRAAVAQVDPELPVFAVATLDDLLDRQTAGPRALGLLMTVFAAVALFLATLGLYGTLAYGVSRRGGEIGIRMALGADASGVMAGVVRRGAALAAGGVVAGLALAALGAGWLEGMLFAVRPVDPLTYGAIAAVLMTAAVAASALPAWRAARVDPADALRGE